MTAEEYANNRVNLIDNSSYEQKKKNRISYFNGEDLEDAFDAGEENALSNQWISVKDKLPAVDDDYVLCHLAKSNEIVSGYIGKDNKVETSPTFEFDAMGDYTCDYWMPIPELNIKEK